MYVAHSKRLTLAGAKKIMATATALAEQAGVARGLPELHGVSFSGH